MEVAKKIVSVIKEQIRFFALKRDWRSLNRNNSTLIGNMFRLSSVEVGNHTYGKIYCLNWGSYSEKLKIGNYCSIAQEVMFILNADHEINNISTFPFKVKLGLDREK